MALKDRIILNTVGMVTASKNVMYKGLAYKFRKTIDLDWQTGDPIDASNITALDGYLQDKVSQMLISWANDAQDYERDQAATPIDISKA